jgi:hypothetical protein
MGCPASALPEPAHIVGDLAGREVTAEFELLCEAARPRPDLTRFRELLLQGTDFGLLAALAAAHGVRPALLDCLGQIAWETVPETHKTALERFRQQHLAHTLALTGELYRLTACLSDAAIPFVAFKGPTLALSLHGNFAGREYNDLDLIVPPQQVDAAEAAIVSLGFASPQGDRAFRRAFLASQRQYAFTREDGTAIDLHWAFSGTHAPFPLAPEDAWDEPAGLAVGNRTVPILSAPNLALLLAGHGTKEGWAMLKWVSDFARLVDRHPDLDWADLHRRARARRCGDAVLLACAVAQDLLGVAIPEGLGPAVAASGRVRARARVVRASLQASTAPPPSGEHFADLLLCDRRIDRIAGALQLTFTPTAGDHDALKLPAALWSAYYVTRPCRLAFRMVLGRT